jgi:hypothetical protein
MRDHALTGKPSFTFSTPEAHALVTHEAETEDLQFSAPF